MNYLCVGYKAFFQRVNEPMKIMAMLMNTGWSASDVMGILAEDEEVMEQAYRNAKSEHPCPCGSGLDYQECHGWKPSSRVRRGRSKLVSQPRPLCI